MQRPSAVDHTIVVRIWIEPHDPRPRARLISLGAGTNATAVGRAAIEDEFGAMLRALNDATQSRRPGNDVSTVTTTIPRRPFGLDRS